jgi:hypothetical protein
MVKTPKLLRAKALQWATLTSPGTPSRGGQGGTYACPTTVHDKTTIKGE